MGTKYQTTYTMSTTPAFYTNYAKDILSNQAAVSARPFTPYDSTQRVAGFNETQQQGFDAAKQNAFSYQPTLNQANTALQDTMGRSSMTAMAPWLASAGQSSASLAAQYMNPYIENIVNRFGELGQRTLQEQLIPGITNKYISAGQIGGPTRGGTGATGAPSGMMTDAARALRDVQEGVLKQQQQAMYEGWNSASNLASQDLSRMGQLASMVASAYGTDTANKLAASGQLAQMAQQMQSQGLAGAKAITDIGNQQQALDQSYKNAAYEEQMRAMGYDQAQIDAMAKTLGAMAPAIPQGQISTQVNKAPSSSLLGTAAGGALTLAGAGRAA